MRKILLLITLSVSIHGFAAGEFYPVNAIPENLLKDANVVYRVKEEQYHLQSLNEVINKTRIVLTVLNEKGNGYAAMVVHYSKSSKVTKFEGTLFNAKGEVLRKLKSKEIGDYSAVDDISIIDDSRVKVHDFNYRTYPYTVEYEIEEKFYITFLFPRWTPQSGQNISVQQSSIKFIVPSDYQLRYKAFNYDKAPVEGKEGKYKTYHWEVKDLQGFTRPFASPLWKDMTPSVIFSPADFSISGYQGNVSSWDGFAKFQRDLNVGRDKLPDHVVQKVKELTAGVADDREKIKILYEYLQKNTRYISIQLGIGGFQPFEASYVAQKGYGDCKALSNYMQCLLKAAGMKSHYTLIYGGRNMDKYYLMEDFPFNPFNHIVLCVPMAKDTVWLECTSQSESAGYMGGFTGNRQALLIDENGGKIVSTPRYGIKENYQRINVKGKLDPDGLLNVSSDNLYRGMEQDDMNSMLNNNKKDEIQKILQNKYDLGTYAVNNFTHTIKKGMLPEVSEQLEVTIPSYATVSGKRIFITPNIFNKGGLRLAAEPDRKHDYVFNYEYSNEDMVEIEIPHGYELETPFREVSLKTRFGLYKASAKIENNKLIYTRLREQYTSRIPAKEGEEVINFYNEMYKADRTKLVLVKKQ